MRIIHLFLSMSLVGCAMRQELPTENDVPGMVRYSSNKAIDHAVRSNEKVSVFLDRIRSDVSEIYSIDERTSLEDFPERLLDDASSKVVFTPLNDGEKILVVSVDSDISLYLRVDQFGSVVAGVSK